MGIIYRVRSSGNSAADWAQAAPFRPRPWRFELLQCPHSISGPLLMPAWKFSWRARLIDETNVPALDELCTLRAPNFGAPASRQRHLLYDGPFCSCEPIAVAVAVKFMRAKRRVFAITGDEIDRLRW
jgi:hypothetical protein